MQCNAFVNLSHYYCMHPVYVCVCVFMLARMNDVKCWYWYIVFLSHNFGPHSRSDNNKPLFVIVRFTSSIKTATHKFHNKKINIQIKTAKPNGEDLLQANIQFGFAYWLHDSYMDFKNPSNRLLWWFFYFLKGIPKWFLSNPKHQLLQTNTHTQITKQMRTIHHVEWEIIMEHRNTKHTHTHTQNELLWMWLSWFSSKWFAFCYDFVRCIMYFPICCKWFIGYSTNSVKIFY